MELVDFALDYRNFSTAKVTSAAHARVGRSGFLLDLPGSQHGLRQPRLGIHAGCHHQCTQRELTGAEVSHVGIRMLAQRGGQNEEADEH